MLEILLTQNESKTLEFKENLSSPNKIIRTVVAFANTAGGSIVIGVEDQTKNVVGVADILAEEERITNLIHDTVSPMIMPDIDIIAHAGKEILIINVPHLAGPFHIKKLGLNNGTFIRLGSSNRLADPETLVNLQRFAKRISFDEMPCIPADINELDKNLISEKLKDKFKTLTSKHYESLNLIAIKNKKKYATYGGLLLFGINKTKWLPDALIQCVSFSSTTKKNILDKREISTNLIDSVDEAILFIQRNTKVAAEIGAVKRIDIPEYPVEAVREAVVNAITHADYSIKATSIQISIFNDRLEITNPGSLPFGQTMHSALSGISKMRNPVIGRIFREIGIIETLGMGILSIIESFENSPAKAPLFEEIDHYFKVTLYARPTRRAEETEWAAMLRSALIEHKKLSTSDIAILWDVSPRTARTRLNKMLEMGIIKRNAKSKNDPHATYSQA